MPLLHRPPQFLPVETDSRVRIFILSREPHGSPSLAAVTTLRSGPEATALPPALNAAAWTGDHRALDEILANLPVAIASACKQALADIPHPSAFAPAIDGYVPEIVTQSHYGNSTSDIVGTALEVDRLHLGFVVVNNVDETGWPEYVAFTMSEAFEINPSGVDHWWPFPEGAELLERRTANDDGLKDLLEDPRWDTHVARLCSLWVRDRNIDLKDSDGWGSEQNWVAEFFDVPLAQQNNRLLFLPGEPEVSDEFETFLTERNRFTVWLAMRQITADLDTLTSYWDDYDSLVRDAMPQVIRSQSRDWWHQLYRSAIRLEEAFRIGGDTTTPRTPGEEALISLATRQSYIDWGLDMYDVYPWLEAVRGQLPSADYDGEWDEILHELTGDIDVEIVWSLHYEERADPADGINRQLGIGDYRPEAWHRLFDREVGHDLPPV